MAVPEPPATRTERLPGSFWRLWWAGAVDNVGDGAFATAVPLLATRLTRSPVLISAVSAATFLPWLVCSLPIGALVDRHDKVGLMWRSQLVQAAVITVMAVLIALGDADIGLLIGMALLLGTCEVIFNNAAQALIPDLLSGPLLFKANGYLNSVISVGQQFLGPPVGSLLFAAGTAAAPFGFNAGSFLASAGLVARLPGGTAAAADHPPMRQAIGEWLRWLLAHRLLRTLALLLGINTFGLAMAVAPQVLLATRTLHVSAAGYGVLLAAAAVGSILGGAVNARIIARVGAAPALFAALAVIAVAFEGVSLSPNAETMGVLLAVIGFAVTMWNVIAASLRQQAVPAHLRGRVNSVYRMIGWGLMPVGALCGGLLAETLGFRAPYAVAGLIRAVALLASFRTTAGGITTATATNTAKGE